MTDAPRTYPYTPFDRVAMALEQALRLCPACGAVARGVDRPKAGQRLSVLQVRWACHGIAAIALHEDGARLSRLGGAPCLVIIPRGVDAAIRAASHAFTCEEVVDADALRG